MQHAVQLRGVLPRVLQHSVEGRGGAAAPLPHQHVGLHHQRQVFHMARRARVRHHPADDGVEFRVVPELAELLGADVGAPAHAIDEADHALPDEWWLT